MSFEVNYRLKFEGGQADLNRLPAHEGSVSLEGMSWSLSLMAHYLSTGKIQKRGHLSPRAKVFIQPARPGSFVTDLIVSVANPQDLYMTSVVGDYAASTLGAIFSTFMVASLHGVAGVKDPSISQSENWLKRFPTGELEAVIDTVEASIRRAHTVIGDGGAETLTVRKGRTDLIVLNRRTKEYVNTDIEGGIGVQHRVSVGAFDANSGNGRVFLMNSHKVVPFSLYKHASALSREAISHSLYQYVHRNPSEIMIECDETLALDGRIKRLFITNAFRTP